ncbi:MAG: hypothetical protein AMXMBFR53_36410 [Gemmatimonadota bacterium]
MGAPYNYAWDAKHFDHGGAVWNIQNKAFGANINGTDPDDTALENILSECAAGDIIVFPPDANYVFDSPDLSKSVTLYGPGATFTKAATTVGHMFSQDQGDLWDGLRVIGIEFNLNRAAFSAGNTVSAFFTVRARNLLFYDVHIRDGIEEGLKLYSCQNVRVLHSWFENIRNNGVQFHLPTSDGYSASGARAKADAFGLTVFDSDFIDIDDGNAGTMDGHGITLNGTDTTYRVRDCQIIGNRTLRCIRGIWGEFGGAAGRQAARSIVIAGNTVRESDYFGIGLVSAEDSIITDNIVTDTGVGVPNPPSTSDETVGIIVTGDTYQAGARVVVKDNIIRDTRGGSAYMEYGIIVRRGSGHTVRDNIISGETVKKIHVVWADVTASNIVGQTPPMAKVTGNSDQTIGTASWTPVTWPTEDYDVDAGATSDSMHSTSSNTDRVVLNMAGRYRISFSVSFQSNATGLRGARLVKSDGSTDVVLAEELRNATNGDDTSFSVTATYEMDEADVGDWIRADVYQSSGGNLAIYRSTPRVHLAVEWIGGKAV